MSLERDDKQLKLLMEVMDEMLFNFTSYFYDTSIRLLDEISMISPGSKDENINSFSNMESKCLIDNKTGINLSCWLDVGEISIIENNTSKVISLIPSAKVELYLLSKMFKDKHDEHITTKNLNH